MVYSERRHANENFTKISHVCIGEKADICTRKSRDLDHSACIGEVKKGKVTREKKTL